MDTMDKIPMVDVATPDVDEQEARLLELEQQPVDQPSSDQPTDQQQINDQQSSIFGDLSKLRLSQSFDGIGVKKVLSMVPCRKPPRQEFVRTHKDPAFSMNTAVLTLKEERDETYIVEPSLWSELQDELIPTGLYTSITRQGVLFLWPVRLQDGDQKSNIRNWSQTALSAVEAAKSTWIRVQANMSLGGYEWYVAGGNIPEPEWPDVSFTQILEICFRDRFIKEMSHPVIKKLRGEM